MTIKETDDIWRLYTREWVIVETVSLRGSDASNAVLAAQEWVKQNLYGRVRDEDIQLQANTDLMTDLFWVHVKVFRNNLKGEFKWRATAERFAVAHGYDEHTIVVRNSKLDHEIRSYGVKKL